MKNPEVKSGDVIELIDMPNDQQPITPGTKGVVKNIVNDPSGDGEIISVKWENGRSLNLLSSIDSYILVTSLSEVNSLKGGKGDKSTPESLAKKHNVSVDTIKKEIKIGLPIEMEHTNSKEKALEIIMDHLYEFHDYYSNSKYGLKKSEKGLEKELDETGSGSAGPVVGKLMEGTNDEFKVNDVVSLIGSNDKWLITFITEPNSIGQVFYFIREISPDNRLGVSTTVNKQKLTKIGEFDVNTGLVKEDTTTYNSGNFDDSRHESWSSKSNKDGWRWSKKQLIPGSIIIDPMSKIDTVWDDSNLSVEVDINISDIVGDVVQKNIIDKLINEKFESKKQQKYFYSQCNDKSLTKKERNKWCKMSQEFSKDTDFSKLPEKKDDLEETTTSTSSGQYSTPQIWASSAKNWRFGNKKVWKGGELLQTINESIQEEDLSKLIDVINSCKNIKKYNRALKMWKNYLDKRGSKPTDDEEIKKAFVQKRKELSESSNTALKPFTDTVVIKDKCKKFPYCDQGNPKDKSRKAVDFFSGLTLENIDKASKILGKDKNEIIEILKSKIV